MIFLRLCCVRMYAAFCPKYRYIGRMLTGRDYIWGRESRQQYDRLSTDRPDQMSGLREKHLWLYCAAKEKEKRKRRLLSEIYFLSVHIRKR